MGGSPAVSRFSPRRNASIQATHSAYPPWPPSTSRRSVRPLVSARSELTALPPGTGVGRRRLDDREVHGVLSLPWFVARSPVVVSTRSGGEVGHTPGRVTLPGLRR